MDLKDQLKNLFPEHTESPSESPEVKDSSIWMQEAPIICKYEKRKGTKRMGKKEKKRK